MLYLPCRIFLWIEILVVALTTAKEAVFMIELLKVLHIHCFFHFLSILFHNSLKNNTIHYQFLIPAHLFCISALICQFIKIFHIFRYWFQHAGAIHLVKCLIIHCNAILSCISHPDLVNPFTFNSRRILSASSSQFYKKLFLYFCSINRKSFPTCANRYFYFLICKLVHDFFLIQTFSLDMIQHFKISCNSLSI